MLDQRFVQVRLGREGELQHDLLALRQRVERLAISASRISSRCALSALLIVTSGSMIGIRPCASDLLGDLELLRHDRRDAAAWRG